METDWTRDLRHALRSLGRSRGFTAVVVGTLGLAIGVNAGIFSVIDAVLLNPLPWAEADRLVYIAASAPGSDFPEEFPVAAEFLVQYREQSQLLESVASFNSFTSTLRVEDRIERIRMSAPSTEIFETLGALPLLGRLPTPEDERVVVLSHTLWTTWFGSDPEVIGRTYYVSGGDLQVIGVMGPDFWFPNRQTLLWMPQVVRPEGIEPGRFGQPLVARTAPGVTPEALIAELGTLAQRLPDRFGGDAEYARLIERHRPVVRALGKELLGAVSASLWVMLGSVGIVLLIACANVANLLMVRGERRRRDLAVRRALGAGRGRLIRAQMAEAVVLAALAGVAAVAFAWATVPLFVRLAPPEIPRLDEVGVTAATLLFTFGASVLAALVCGLGPAVRSSSGDPQGLRDGGRGATRRRHWGRNGLVVAQTALALVLLIGSGLLVRSFFQLRNVDPGYDIEDVFTFQIAPEGAHLRDIESYARFHLDFMDRLAALPGVERVGIVENVPLNEGVSSTRFRTEETVADQGGGALLSFTWVAGDYFATMGIDLLQGRSLSREEHLDDRVSVVLSHAAAYQLWPGEDPIGRRIKAEEGDKWMTVVGLVEDVLQDDFRGAPEPLVYLPLSAIRPISSPAYVLKTPRAREIAPEVLALVREVAPTAPMYRIFTLEDLAADSMVRLSFTMLTLGVVSALALLLGAVGLYGLLASVVAERTQEIGVRMALGAQAARVRRMVVGQGARVVVLGVAVGAGVAVAAMPALQSLLFGVDPLDAWSFAGMSLAMVLVGMLAAYVPARRASRVNPIEALRME